MEAGAEDFDSAERASSDLRGRIEELERAIRWSRLMALVALCGVAGLLVFGGAATGEEGTGRGPAGKAVRTERLVIEDAEGRDRIVMGAPMPDGREHTGMKILNKDAAEQFGLGLGPEGAISMGFDVRPGVGDPRNRERLNLGVRPSGEGWIRFLDNQTRARMYVRLDSAGTPWVEFFDWSGDNITVRQVGFPGRSTYSIGR